MGRQCARGGIAARSIHWMDSLPTRRETGDVLIFLVQWWRALVKARPTVPRIGIVGTRRTQAARQSLSLLQAKLSHGGFYLHSKQTYFTNRSKSLDVIKLTLSFRRQIKTKMKS